MRIYHECNSRTPNCDYTQFSNHRFENACKIRLLPKQRCRSYRKISRNFGLIYLPVGRGDLPLCTYHFHIKIPGRSNSLEPTCSVSSTRLESPSQPCNTQVSKSPSSSPPPSLSFSASTPTNKGARRHSPAHQAKYHVLLAPPSIHPASNPLWLKNRHAALGSTSARFAYKMPFQPPCTF